MKQILFLRDVFFNFFGNTRDLILLNILHIFNDGSKVGLYILLPFAAQQLHINLAQVGFLGSMLNVCLILFAVPAGYIAARIGGVKALLVATLFYAFGFLATGFANSFLFLIVTFFIAGMGYGVFHPISFILLTKWSDKSTRGKEMGNFTALGDIGTAVIPGVLAFLITCIGWRTTSMASGLVFVLLFILFSFLMKPESAKEEKREHKHINLLSFFKHKHFLLAAMTGCLDNFASSSLILFLPFLLLAKGMPAAWIGIFATVYFIGSFIGKAYLGRSMDKFGNVNVFVFSEICMAIFIMVLTLSTFLPLIFIASVIVGCFTKGTAPVAITMLSDVVDTAGNSEKIFGVNGFINGFFVTLSPLILGIISNRLGISSAFFVMAFIALLATIPALGLKRINPK